MNLRYVKDYLKNALETSNEDTQDLKQNVEDLVKEIDTFQGTENKFMDIGGIMKTISDYNITFLTHVQEFEVFKKEDIKTLPKRAEKVREILCTLSSLHTYLVLSLANIKDSTYNMKNIRTYMTELNERKEHFKSEKMTWATVLKSLVQEMAFTSEMRKMDIEDRVGYLKYKDN